MYKYIDTSDELVHNMNCKEVSIMPTEKPRYTVTVDEELLKRIDDFRFENRYISRSAATLDLIRIGIEELEKRQEEAKKAQKNSTSQESETDK
jgi:Arc/MetJ-type ribon-helix-helix transcriptional regulator